MMAESCVDLKLDRNLLDPHFDGYKLSLDPLATYEKEITSAADVVPLSEAQYSYQHIKAYGLHNHLTSDPWHPNTVYFVDQHWKVQRISMNNNHVDEAVTVMQLPAADDQKLVPDRVSVSMHFPDAHWAVLADGAGVLYTVETGDRDRPLTWNIRYSGEVLGDKVPFVLRHSSMKIGEGIQSPSLDCILIHVEKRESPDARDEEDGGPVDKGTAHIHFVSVIEWATLTQDSCEEWSLSRSRRLEGSCSPDYLSLDDHATSLYMAGEKPFKFVYDSTVPVEEQRSSSALVEGAKSQPLYTWNQTDEDVSVQITLPSGKHKNDIIFTLSPDEITVGCDPDLTFLQGQLNASVEVDACSWSICDGNRLEVSLEKVEKNSTWPHVVVGDTHGEMVLDPAEVDRIHQRLAHLTSEHWNPDLEEDKKVPYNAQQLEDCDDFPDEASTMTRWNGDTHCVSHKVNLSSNQWLFNCSNIPGSPLACCLRHDVDGVIWQPSMDIAQLQAQQTPFTHTATFNAFGYVQASKKQRKFTCCPPNHSFVVICDCVRHVYIYRQPSPIDSPLRNRKTGRQVSSLAKQQLASLESVADIVGCQATNQWVFVLSGKKFYAIRVNIE